MRKPKQDDAPTRIIHATLALIAEKGADALRTREILERAGVSNLSAVSYYFGSLDNLRVRAIERYFEGIRAVIADINATGNPRAALLDYCRRMARFVLDHPALERNIVSLAMAGDQVTPLFAGIIQENIRALSGLILRGRKDQDPIKAQYDAIALASATIYPLLLAAYGPGAVGIDVLAEDEREKYFANLADRLLGSVEPAEK